MVLGLRSKHKKGSEVQLYYLISVQDIRPWPPSQSLISAKSVLLQWESGDHSSGSFASTVGDGRVEFSESFRLPVTLCRKGRDSFQKNFLEFNLYEPRKDKAMKGQLLGSAIFNLADYGIIKDAMSLNTPISFKKSFRVSVQPVLYIDIQPFDKDNSSLSKEASLDKDGSETVSEVTNEGNDEEREITSFTDDDEDDNLSSHSSLTVSSSAMESHRYNLSSHSSLTVSSSAMESHRGSPGQHDKNGSKSENNGVGRVNKDPTSPLGVAPLNPQNPFSDHAAKVVLPDDDYAKMSKNSDLVGFEESRIKNEADRKARRHEASGVEEATTRNLHVGLEERGGKELQNTGRDVDSLEVNKHPLDEKLDGELTQDAVRKPVKLKSNTLALDRTAVGVHGSTRRDKLKHLKSVQLQFESSEGDAPLDHRLLLENSKKVGFSDNNNKSSKAHPPSERKETANNFSDNKVKLKSKVQTHDSELAEASASMSEVGTSSLDSEAGNATYETQLIEKAKKIVHSENFLKDGVSYVPTIKEEKQSTCYTDKAELESNVEMLKEELMEAAALEVGLYSIVAEHGSSANKVLAPARRLSRFYLHACSAKSRAARASTARAIISGLVLVSKACGNDVPRLAFWLSNSIVLRAIVSQAAKDLQLDAAQSTKSNVGREKYIDTRSLDEWEEPQTYIDALEKVEAWIFSRIVESVWWQTLTPYMQSTAVKSSSSRKNNARRHGFGDQEQGNFAIDLWKKAFQDACERLCPIRASGHECGCLHVLARLVMEQLVSRLDVAMFNAILRESAEDMPTDPISDPISDAKVLPIPSGKASFGAGVQLKNAVGNWSRWLTDLFGIDENDAPEDKNELDGNSQGYETSFKPFHLLNALSDLMMLPFEMLADRSTRKEVCPTFAAPLIKRVLYSFVPDEFNPDPIPEAILDALDTEDLEEAEEKSISSFPCIATPTAYSPPSAASLANIIGDVRSQTLQRTGSVLRKSYTSDDELEELDSPMASIITENSKASPVSPASNWTPDGKGARKVVRYQLLRGVWKVGE